MIALLVVLFVLSIGMLALAILPDGILSLFYKLEPHGVCFLWNPSLVWLHAVGNGLIALAYFYISYRLLRAWMRTELLSVFKGFQGWALVNFGAFILTCGVGHVIDTWVIWSGVYWFQGLWNIVTAYFSVATALGLAAVPTPSTKHGQVIVRK